MGMLRTGRRDLYLPSSALSKFEKVLCVLDFFVVEQRKGIGFLLFDGMLRDEGNVCPTAIAYDKPSEKLLNFLRKHFGLKNACMQYNKFVIFPDGFYLFNSSS